MDDPKLQRLRAAATGPSALDPGLGLELPSPNGWMRFAAGGVGVRHRNGGPAKEGKAPPSPLKGPSPPNGVWPSPDMRRGNRKAPSPLNPPSNAEKAEKSFNQRKIPR
jgi:hypothetical protein